MTVRLNAYICACLVLAILAIWTALAALADIRIGGDPGGNVSAYLARVEAARASGERVMIDRQCFSACTLWLSLPPSQICVTPRAVFGFHSATNELGIPDPKANDMLWHSYPERVRIAVGKRGGLWLGMIYIRGAQIARLCR